jgi:hypothetical protein
VAMSATVADVGGRREGFGPARIGAR